MLVEKLSLENDIDKNKYINSKKEAMQNREKKTIFSYFFWKITNVLILTISKHPN